MPSVEGIVQALRRLDAGSYDLPSRLAEILDGLGEASELAAVP